jgi:hypothetical protein
MQRGSENAASEHATLLQSLADRDLRGRLPRGRIRPRRMRSSRRAGIGPRTAGCRPNQQLLDRAVGASIHAKTSARPASRVRGAALGSIAQRRSAERFKRTRVLSGMFTC